MARAKNIRSLNQRPGQQIKEQYRGCNRVGWPSHWDVGQPLNHQHEMSNMPAVAQAIFFRRRHQPSNPPLAKIRPGRPAPAMGPGTAKGTFSVISVILRSNTSLLNITLLTLAQLAVMTI
jgi:hypothetical protein